MRILTCLLVFLCSATFAQERSVSGVVSDSTDRATLIGVTVLLVTERDTTQLRGTVTDTQGRFNFSAVKPGRYFLKLSYIGYTSRKVTLNVSDASVDLGNITIGQSAITLKSVQVSGTPIQVEQ